MRMAQFRARNQRLDLNLPPLESMASVLSALNQLTEAIAADMIDLKRADLLLKTLRFAAQALKSSDKWLPSVYHTDVAAPAIDLAAEYGLPHDLDLDVAPEVAFPPSDEPAVADTGYWPLASGNSDLSPMPTVDYCTHGPGCPEHTIRADYPETPEKAQLREILNSQGQDAMVACYKQQQRNNTRRHVNTARKRYAAVALESNLRLAAERIAERKLAEREEQKALKEQKAIGCPIPPSVGGVGVSSGVARKPAASAAATSGETIATKEAATA